jgi:DNA-binding CsgD family transcriptional regulator
LLSLNFAAASAWFTLTDGTKRLSTHRHLVRRSLAKALATRLPQRSSTVVMWPGGLDFECPLPGCPAGPYQLVVPLHVGLDQLSAWLLGRAGRVFSEAEAEHATLLAPGLRLRVSRTEQPPQCDDLPWLTERELGVLELVSRGLTARAVARRSGISERTVQKHLEHVYEKLGCRDRLSAVMRAREAGLLPPLLLAE